MTASPPSSVPTRRVGFWLFALALSAYVATSGGSMATDPMTYEVTRSMVESGSVAMSFNVQSMEAHRGVDGRYYAPYGIGHALYNVPFYLVGRTVEGWLGAGRSKPEIVRKAVVVLGSTVAAALAVWLTFVFAAALAADARAAVLTALALGFATLLWPYAKFGFNAPLATVCLLAGAYAAWRAARHGGTGWLVGAGAGIGSALLVRQELALAVVPVVAALWLANRDGWGALVRRVTIFGVPIAAAVLVTLYYNDVRFGNPIDTGYLRDQTDTSGPLLDGLTGLLFSPGRSVLLYSPVTLAGIAALAGLWRRNRDLLVLLGGQVLVLLVFYASLSYWDADRSYGPRYLLPVLPCLVLPLVFWFRDGVPWPGRPRGDQGGGRRRTRGPGDWLLAGLIGVSVLVQIPGVLVDFSKVGYTPAVGQRTLQERRWSWDAAGLTLNTRAALAAIPVNWRYLSGVEPLPTVAPAERKARDFAEQLAFSLDFWWAYAVYLRLLSARAALALGLASFAVVGACGWCLWRALGSRHASVRR